MAIVNKGEKTLLLKVPGLCRFLTGVIALPSEGTFHCRYYENISWVSSVSQSGVAPGRYWFVFY